jgi:hypothetical protein
VESGLEFHFQIQKYFDLVGRLLLSAEACASASASVQGCRSALAAARLSVLASVAAQLLESALAGL